MGLPTSVTIEVAFATDPLATIPTWTDITAYVAADERMTIRRGRASETDEVQPGTLSLTLDNTDGRFTAGKTGSPYYPNVTINRRIRVSAVYGGTTYRLFDGHVDRWPLAWEGGTRALVQVTATDRSKLLARRTIRTPLEEEVLADSPVLFWPLAESSGSEAAGDVARLNSSAWLTKVDGLAGEGSMSFGADWRMLYSTAVEFAPEVDTTAAFTQTGWSWLEGDATVLPVTEPLTVEGWVLISELGYSGGIGRAPLLTIGNATTNAFTWRVHGGGTGSDGQIDTWPGVTTRIDDGRWHHLVETRDGATQKCYLDGTLVYSGTSRPDFDRPANGHIWLGGYDTTRGVGSTPIVQWAGRMARVAIYSTVLTGTQVTEHYEAGRPSFTELSSARVQRIAGWAGIPTGTVDTGRSAVTGDQDTGGRSAISALQDVARSEDGLLYFAGDGTLTFRSRALRMNQPVTVTLDASQGQVSADLQFELSDAVMVNDVAVDRPRGGPMRTVDETSVSTFGTYAQQVSTLLTSDEETQAFGQWQLARRSTPSPRAGRVTVDAFTQPTLYPSVLGADLGARVQLTNLPTATAPAATVDVVIEGVEHVIAVDRWDTTWDTSPHDPSRYLVWDTDTWDNALWAW